MTTLIEANQRLVLALDRIHVVINGIYVDSIAHIVNNALAANAEAVAQSEAPDMELESYYKRMFKAACIDLGRVAERLGLDPNLGGAAPIIEAIDDITSSRGKTMVVLKPLTNAAIECLREQTFSTNNPYCPVDSKSMRKAVRAAECAHNINATGGKT